MFPEPEDFGLNFYELFRVHPEVKKKIEWKKQKSNKPLKGKENRKPKIYSLLGSQDQPKSMKASICYQAFVVSTKQKVRQMPPYQASNIKFEVLQCLDGTLHSISQIEIVGEVPPEIEVAGNASSFAVFSTVRLAVLERWMKEANDLYLTSSSSAPPQSSSNYDSEDENSSPSPQPPRIPKIVGVGLRSVFELIRESRASHPALCTRALSALLDVVQGHQPEALKLEPPEVVEPLLELLLELATMSHEATNDASHLTSVACSCLISLVIARGDTGKLLSALAALLMCPQFLAVQPIHVIAGL